MRCLIIDSDIKHISCLKKFLQEEAFAVDVALDGERGSFLARVHDYDLIILDELVPAKTAAQVCLDLRGKGRHAPIIALCHSANVRQRIELFSAGVDDCLCKPYSFSELLARIRAILRRGAVLKEQVFHVGELMLNCTTQQVYVGRKLVVLSSRQYAILELLIRNRGRIVSRAEILEHVWNMDADPFSNAMETHIWKLRKRLGPKMQTLIRNVLSRGYIID
jgi:DNA-binding response OmpR family regulator